MLAEHEAAGGPGGLAGYIMGRQVEGTMWRQCIQSLEERFPNLFCCGALLVLRSGGGGGGVGTPVQKMHVRVKN
jgi:hypothetical protein